MNERSGIPLGIVLDMPSDDYHSLRALGSSGIKKLAKSPRHYFGTTLDPLRPIFKPTPAMEAGTLAHCALLEPQALLKRYVVRPDGTDLRTTLGKAWAASISKDMIVVTAEQMQTAKRQADAVRALPDIAALLENGHSEVSAFWIDEETGELCKCRPDRASPAGDGVILLDLKSCQDASPAGFSKAIANLRYHLQDAWYSTGYAQAAGIEVLGFVFAAVEADYPHAAAAYMLDNETRAIAIAENRRLLDLYAACKRANDWPGYATGIELISLPRWAIPVTFERIA